jgi:hypothetical protein
VAAPVIIPPNAWRVGGKEENQEKHQWGQAAYRPRIEPGTYRTRSCSSDNLTATFEILNLSLNLTKYNAMKEYPVHSLIRHQMVVSGQLQAPAASPPPQKQPPVPTG